MHRTTKRTAALAAVLAALVALLAATAALSAPAKEPPATPSNLTAVLKAVKGLKVADRQAKLVELAKAEGGQLNVYTSLSSLVVKPLQAEWAKDFPDIKLNLYRGSSEDVTAKVLSEVSANASGADIVETNGTNMLIFQHKKNVLVPFTKSPYRIQVPAKYRFDTFTADRLEEFVVAWNTNLVKNPPTSFQDLARPEWKGKLTIEPTDVDWFAQLYNYFTKSAKKKMSEKAATAMFKAIAANAQLINGHTAQANALASGQVQVIVSGHAQSIEQLQAKKAPVAFGPPFVTPVVERPQGMGIAYRLAHPAAAVLFYDWMLSKRGQQILLQNGVQPANPYFKDNAFASKPFTVQMDLRPIVAHYAAWQKKFSQITGAQGG